MSGYAVVEKQFLKIPEVKTQLPTCADLGSAGDDFFSKETVVIQPGEQHLFWTDVKAEFPITNVLYIFVRSSIGTKKKLRLANTTGVIDSSYFGNEKTDGNIGICLHNFGSEPATIERGERIAQGVLSPVAFMSKRNPQSETRKGGFGSSNE